MSGFAARAARQQALLMGGEPEGGAILRLAPVDVRVVARHDHDDVGRLRHPGHGVLAALGELQLENLQGVVGDP